MGNGNSGSTGGGTGNADNRRRYVRHRVESPCKIVEIKSGRAISGVTRDVSLGGLLVALRTPTELTPGDRIRIGVAWRGQAVLDMNALSEAEVVRALPPFNGQQTVAIRRISPPVSAMRRAA